MKVLVTGGAGFIGSHVVNKILAQGHETVIVDNLSTGRKENVNPNARLFNLDIFRDDLMEIFTAERFDFVIHLAAQTAVQKSLDEPDYDCRVNVLGTVNVLEASRKTGVRRIVFASSAAVYGDVPSIAISEDTPVLPTSFYGLSKLVAENYIKLYYELFGMEYIVLRYANVYGERQGVSGEGGVISIFTRKFLNDQPIDIFGDGGQTRDFVYVGDVADANYRALVSSRANAVYNISTATEISVNQMVDMLSLAVGKGGERRYLPTRQGDICRSCLNNRAALKDLDWQPEMSLADGLAITYNYLRR